VTNAAEPVGGERPALRIVRGDATPEELAALVAVLARRPTAAAAVAAPASRWASRSAAMRGPLGGPWRSSGLPR
jgi:hypothetical protein